MICAKRVLATIGIGLAAALAALSLPSTASAIVGGRLASEQYSFVAQTYNAWGAACPGTLIAPRWVLTRAGCTNLTGQDRLNSVRIGSNDNTKGGVLVGVANVYSHPRYLYHQDPGDYSDTYNIGLVELAQAVSYKPAPLLSKPAAPGDPIRQLGWGYTCEAAQGCRTEQLKELDTRVAKLSDCNSFNLYKDFHYCVAKVARGQDVCNGDQGAPAVSKVNGEWRLAGFFEQWDVNHRRCFGTQNTAYANPLAYLDWIRSRTG